VLAPIARRGTTISIRKFFAERLTPAHLVQFGSLSEAMARFLEAAIALRINIVVAGGTGSGKTSLLNALASYIAADERILTIEDSAELQLGQPHVVTLESRPSDREGKGAVDIGDLLHSALRLRPDRIIVGEVRGGEAFHLLQAMNTGHGGSLTTTHANTPTDTLRRLESLCLLSGVDLPLRAVRAQVASAVHLVVCCERLQDGSRKVTHIAEVLPLDERGEYRVQDLFVYTQGARGPEGEVLGVHAPTGLVPLLFARLQAAGFPDLDAAFFDPRAQGLPAPEVFAAALGTRSQPPPPPGDPRQGRAAEVPAAVEPLVRAAAREPDDEPSIQLDAELAAEVQRRLPHESTLITRNPLFEGPAVDASARAGEDQETSPGTRNPHRR
jgi:pilus assembly protein CpaF